MICVFIYVFYCVFDSDKNVVVEQMKDESAYRQRVSGVRHIGKAAALVHLGLNIFGPPKKGENMEKSAVHRHLEQLHELVSVHISPVLEH